jgi:hypothetical protein
MTPPNKPNSSPELTEVLRAVGRSFEREARRIGLLLPSGPDRDCYSFANTGLSNRDIRLAAILIPQALEALSTKNELPSEIEGLLRQARDELSLWMMLLNEGGVPRYTITPGAALNTVVTSTKRIIPMLNAALNPKDTDTTPLVTGRE